MNSPARQQLWTRFFLQICLINLFVFINYHALLTTFPFFLTHLGGDAVSIGIATALFSLASILSRPLIGWLVDTQGRCLILAVGLVGMGLVPMGYYISAGVVLAIILRTFHGAFHAATTNAGSTWVTDILPRSRMGEGMGMYGLSMAVGTAIAPAIALNVMGQFGFGWLFLFATLAAGIGLALCFCTKDRPYTLSSAPLKLTGLLEKNSLPAAATQFFYMMGYGTIEVYVSLYASDHGLPSGALYFATIAVATVLSRFILGRSLDTYGESLIVLSGNAAMVGGYLLLVLVQNYAGYIASAALLGYSFGALQPAMQAMAMHAVTPNRRGAASSTYFIAIDLGIALGGFAAGVLAKQVGYDAMFLILSLSGVCSYTCYYLFGRRHISSFNPAVRRDLAQQAPPNSPTLPFVVTLSREYGSGGHRIGQLLAQKLGVRLYDQSLIRLIARQSGLQASDIMESEYAENGRMYDDNPIQDTIFHSQRQVIQDIAAKEPCVIVGRLANFILQGREHCFNIFIYASDASRCQRIKARDGISDDDALPALRAMDRRRREYCQHATGCTWGDRCHYHVLADSSGATPEAMADRLCQLVRQIAAQEGASCANGHKTLAK